MKYDENDVNLLITMVIILLGAMALVGWKLMTMLSKNRDMHLLEMKQVALEHEKVLMQAKLDMQEDTFQQIAQELHDNIKTSLILSRLDMYTLENATETPKKEKLQSPIRHIEDALNNLDDLSGSLNSDRIRGLGLYVVLEQEIDKFTRTGLCSIETHYSGNQVIMDPDRELSILRIVQETFNNSIKHSAAKKIVFSADYLADHACFTIMDDGKGFDYSETGGRNKGAGLYNMRLRAKALNASLKIDTGVGKGTSLSLKVPYNPNIITPKTVTTIKKFNALQRLLLLESYRPKIAIDFLGISLCQFFLWEQQLWPGLAALFLSFIIGMAIAWRQDIYKLAETSLGMVVLILAKPLNILFCAIGLIAICYGVWLNSWYVIAAGVIIIFTSSQLHLKAGKKNKQLPYA